MEFEQYRQAVVDEDQLGWLPIMFWVSGGVGIFVSLYFLIYIAFGILIASTPSSSDAAPPAIFGWMFAGIGTLGFVSIVSLGVLKILCGFWIRKRKHRIAIMVIAGISCLEIPYGTLLGVLTFMILGRASVAALFGKPSTGPGGQWVAPPAPEAPGSFAHRA